MGSTDFFGVIFISLLAYCGGKLVDPSTHPLADGGGQENFLGQGDFPT
jgi:hypothetical protein